MMEAKDTVMPLSQILDSIKYEDGEVGVSKFERLALAQAEISFNIGETHGFEVGIAQGRREVVEWYEYGGSCFLHHAPLRRECSECKKARLKEWGL